ncbi:helix-turn-helix domain-containing protein [Flavobacterium piscisymbiosum]|uniref:Helix-turn-helix domain-containing protein n=1 Tax=Flavobacterium piscisymbiosum TaxID=2893753 RepID=A0ABS8MDT0_9FLAO|nr:helix-turn-helix domain-containing protein [Flavobacterium sp. F-30]MCC9063674.1 helix-turn-helix domain-containing protein [Flavobacterium sp. F-30]
MNSNEKKMAFIIKVKELIEPVVLRLETIDSKISQGKVLRPQYYRNEDLKKMFGLSNNTIIKYRQTGILPYTKLGDIFLYDSGKIDKILKSNES